MYEVQLTASSRQILQTNGLFSDDCIFELKSECTASSYCEAMHLRCLLFVSLVNVDLQTNYLYQYFLQLSLAYFEGEGNVPPDDLVLRTHQGALFLRCFT